MPRIPRSDPSVRLAMTNQPTMSPDALTGPGRALQQLGNAISGLADNLAEPSDQEKFQSQLAQLQFHNEAQDKLQEMKTSFTPDSDPAIFSAGWDDWYKTRSTEYRGSISQNPKIQQNWMLNDERLGGTLHRDAFGFQASETTKRTIQSVVGTFTGTIAKAPSGDPAAMAALVDMIDGQIGRVQGASPAQVEHMRASLRAAAVKQLLLGVDPVDQPKVIEDFINATVTDKSAPEPDRGLGPQSNVIIGPTKSDGMAIVTAGSGARVRVSGDYADRFAGLISELEAKGLKIDPKQTGGYANRNIAGTAKKSRHAFGEAVDINWTANARGKPGAIRDVVPPDEINVIAAKWGLKWGGNWKNPDDMHFEVDRTASPSVAVASRRPAVAPGDSNVDLSAYSPRKGGDAMEGGYAAAKPGPDGKAEVRTLADVAAGRSEYVTVAGNPRDYGKTFTIPEVTFVDAKGQRKTLKNVQAVVHDTGGAFKDAPEGRFDLPIDRDATNKQMAASHAMWKKQGVSFVAKGEERSNVASNGAINAPVRVADASGRIPGSAISGHIKDRVEEGGERAPNAIPKTTETAEAQKPRWVKPSIRTGMTEQLIEMRPAALKQRSDALDELIKRAETSAADGYVLPEDERTAINQKIAEYGTEEQRVKLAAAEQAAQVTAGLKKLTPTQLSSQATQLRSAMNVAGATPEVIAKAKAVEGLHTRMVKELNENSVGWAAEAGLVPPQEPITVETFTPETLANRKQVVDLVAQHYGPEFSQYFSKDERDNLSKVFEQGGDNMMAMMGVMYEAFGDDMPKGVAEISPKAPEAAIAGYLLATGGDPQAVKDIAATIERRADPNYKGHPKFDTPISSTADDVLSDAFRNWPRQRKDAVLRAAEAIYTARVKDPSVYEPELADAALKAAVGEKTNPGGVVFGGVVQTKPGIFGRNGEAIILPSNVRQDTWRELFDSVTVEDLKQAGQPLPVDGNGTPLSLTRAVNARIVQAGEGRYVFALGDPSQKGNEKWIMAAPVLPAGVSIEDAKDAPPLKPAEPFVLDLKALTPILRTRMPDLFWSE